MDYGYGDRKDGTKKGRGYFGEIKGPDGTFSTELSTTVDFGNGDEDIPLLVPVLTKAEIDHIIAGNKPTEETVEKAINFALARKKAGQSPYAGPDEEGSFKVPDQ
jgi:hypothetical protein